MSRSEVDVAIVGGGIIGCSLAYELARRGVSVAVVERGQVGRESSGAAAGIISPPSSTDQSEAKAALTARSVLDYPAFIEAIEGTTGSSTGWKLRGELTVAFTDEELARLLEVADLQERLGFHVQSLDGETARELEPILPKGIVGGTLIMESASLFTYQLTRTTAEAALRHGAQIIEHTPVMQVLVEGGRTTGLRLADGFLPAGQVVLAAGAWTAGFGLQLDVPLPTVPVKGQMLAIAGAPVMPERIIARFGGGYLVPRPDGTVAVGATKEHANFDKRISPRNVELCLAMMREFGPALFAGEISAIWTGLRPGSLDDDPIIGRVPGYDALWVATGHYMTGIQQAPATAELLAASILAGEPAPELTAFDPARFGRELA